MENIFRNITPLQLSDPNERLKGSKKCEEWRAAILLLDIIVSLHEYFFPNDSAKLKFKHPNRHWTLVYITLDNSVPANYLRFRKTFVLEKCFFIVPFSLLSLG